MCVVLNGAEQPTSKREVWRPEIYWQTRIIIIHLSLPHCARLACVCIKVHTHMRRLELSRCKRKQSKALPLPPRNATFLFWWTLWRRWVAHTQECWDCNLCTSSWASGAFVHSRKCKFIRFALYTCVYIQLEWRLLIASGISARMTMRLKFMNVNLHFEVYFDGCLGNTALSG